MKRKTFILLFLFVTLLVNAQEEKEENSSPFSVSLELTSKYMWRGIEYGNSPVIFPSVTFASHGISAYAMGGLLPCFHLHYALF